MTLCRHRSAGRSRLAVLAMVGGTVTAAYGGWLATGAGVSAPEHTAGTVPVAHAAAPSAPASARPGSAATGMHREAPERAAAVSARWGGIPRMLTLGDARVAVVPVGLAADGSLALPESGRVAGWWADGAAPGDERGTVVIAGHVDTLADGAGSFASLAALSVGERVTVTDAAGGSTRYVVTGLRTYDGAGLPGDLFDRSGAPRLALITCSGHWDAVRRSYRHNLVVWARPG